MYLTIKPRLARKSTSQSLVDYDTNERLKGEWTCTSWGSYSVATGWTTKGRGSTCKLNLTIIILFHSWVQEYIFVHLIKTRTILLSAMLWPPSAFWPSKIIFLPPPRAAGLLLDTFTKSHDICQTWTAFQRAVTQYALSPSFTVMVRVCGAATVPWPCSSALWIFICHCLEVRNSHYAVLDLLK